MLEERVSNDWCINKNKNVLLSIPETPAWSSELLSFGRLLGGEGAEQFLSAFLMTVQLVSEVLINRIYHDKF